MRVKSAAAFWLCVVLVLVAGCDSTSPPEDIRKTANADTSAAPTGSGGRVAVVSTVSPVTNIVYNIGGPQIDLVGIVPEGVNSHTFEPAPSDARLLATADLIFINGLDLEEPTLKLAEANKKAGAEIVLLGELTIEPEEYVYDFSFPREDGKPNPHLWLNPYLALHYAEIVRDKLIERDPLHADEYRANFERFEVRISELDAVIRAAVDSIPVENRKLLTYHDSWAYFAPNYGIGIIGAIQPADFSEPSAREMADLIVQLRNEKIPAIFGSEVFPSPALEQIAREGGAAYVDTLRDDDLPGAPGDEEHSYFGMMAANLATMTQALSGDPALVADFDISNIPGRDQAVGQAQE